MAYNSMKSAIEMIPVVISLLLGISTISFAQCPYDVSPCNCHQKYNYSSGDNDVVTCDRVSMATIKAIFETIPETYYLNTIYFKMNIDDFIPENVLGQSRVNSLTFEEYSNYTCVSSTFRPSLTADPDSFASSRNTLNSISFICLNMSHMDLEFLTGFNKLSDISFFSLINMENSLSTLPFLPRLSYLSLESISDLDKALEGPSLKCNGLTSFYCGSGYYLGTPTLGDNTISKVVNWLLPSSASTLKDFSLRDTNITTTPLQLQSFEQLDTLWIQFNRENWVIKAGSLFTPQSKVSHIVISSDNHYWQEAISIEADAFQGDYSFAQVRLSYFLTRFEAGVFQSMLQQMSVFGSSKAFVDVDNNKFDCYTDPCHLAWLLRDNRHLLAYLRNAVCFADKTPFENLAKELFADCPSTSTLSPPTTESNICHP